MKDLDAIMADRDGEAVPDAPAEFNPETAEPVASPEDTGEARHGTVPHQALHAERQKARRLEEENAELRQHLDGIATKLSQRERTPELWDDPDLYLDHRMAPLASEIGEMKEFVSETLAVQTYGSDAVEAAKRNAEDLARSGAPEFQGLWARLSRSRHPMDELVRWDREQSALRKYGADPDAYIASEIENRLYGRASPHAAPAARQQLPSSFAAARSSGPRGSGGGGPRSLSEIMNR
ncbi:hypothetical protein IZ6_10890 [Terrihabitans soli]|uniref:Uncharacterized protein n=1 Tax=Terrihabitans soli TaxID=708113 RepID=A0A6S6QJA3_9HYPH|nr:hypothetical protein [Terrihabitans soli]BCJ90354.1 hypothetical protein IZ6_10890 [Terrihabitans soli]